MVCHISFTSSCFSYGILNYGRTRNRTRWCFTKKIIVSTSVRRISDSVHRPKTWKTHMITESETVRRPRDNHASHTNMTKLSNRSKVSTRPRNISWKMSKKMAKS
ncbi:hypothetical protein AR158_c394R [Paramecium bursaria Chlorella virus AR158]|uniref:hypothetical protein n=1 Tax=Paramecium bursaria Chlorella virus AR158 TaxID=380598 RepID=UPI00015AA6B3|nr:hypothetical protein AR158_c394R [Paramecium bursaria Chlorella virus AR158]ABU43939.1 hypothetical protein AR158_c394R [Paramecium bursaria Chlorella virus AR158]